MHKIPNALKLIIMATTAVVLTACHESHHGGSNSNTYDYYRYETPEIHSVEIIDTVGRSNMSYPYQTPIIDPYQDHGYFEVWWDVSSYNEYHATLYINDYNSLLGAIELERTQCGPFEQCDLEGFMYCGYSLYDTLSCSAKEYQTQEVDIAKLIYDHPEHLYLLLEVCDKRSGYCDSQSELAIFK